MVEFSFTNLVVVGSGAVAVTVINTDDAYVKMSRCRCCRRRYRCFPLAIRQWVYSRQAYKLSLVGK